MRTQETYCLLGDDTSLSDCVFRKIFCVLQNLVNLSLLPDAMRRIPLLEETNGIPCRGRVAIGSGLDLLPSRLPETC